jgi:hypothetical protein
LAGGPNGPRNSFRKRHPELAFKWAKRGEAKRGKAVTRNNVQSFYDNLERILNENDIHRDDIYNMDEKGLQENGGCLRKRVCVAAEMDEAKIHGDESKKMVTVLECASAGGFMLKPLLIHQGAGIDGSWVDCNPCKAQ